MRRIAMAAAAVAGLAGAAPAGAQTGLTFGADATRTGVVDLFLAGPPHGAVTVDELVGGAPRRVAIVKLDAGGFAVRRRAAEWRCDRRVRRLVAAVARPEGGRATATFTVRTPSCARRLRLRAPRRARRGASFRVTVRDTWRLGGVRARLCLRAPGGRRACRPVALPRGRVEVRPAVRLARRGRWRVEVRTSAQRAGAIVAVGVRPPQRRSPLPAVVLAGDSMMQPVDTFLADRLAGRAEAVDDVHVGTGLSKPGYDWAAGARRRAAALRPRATVVFLGANDSAPMRGVACCGEAWVAEYARRAAAVMRAYARGGRGRVVWLTLPAPRDRRLRPHFAAVNAAVRRAAAGQPAVRAVALDAVLTPGFRYRATMELGGRTVRVRAADGIHLSLAGAELAAWLADSALPRLTAR